MAKHISEILAIERNRQYSQMHNVIHIFKEGAFYRAYEWSAWLIAVIVNTATGNSLAITKKKAKDSDDTFVFAGFPLTSMEKYIPKEAQLSFTPVSDDQIDITVELPIDIAMLGEEGIKNLIMDWSKQFKLKEKQKKPSDGDSNQDVYATSPRITRLSDIASQIVAFPLENKSPMEAWDFLSQLRKQIAAIF